MKLFSIDVKVWATAYIQASSPEEAAEIARGLKDTLLDVKDAGADIAIDGQAYENAPRLSLSPAMTVEGPEDGATPECVHDSEEDA